MDSDDRSKRAERMRPQLREAAVDRSLRSIARDLDLSHATLSSFLNGGTPSNRTLDKLERWLGHSGHSGRLKDNLESGTPEYADPTGSPAERLIYYFSHPDAVRQLGPGVTAEDRVKAAYAIAIEDGWPEEEIDKLDAWRREVLGCDTGGD